MTIFYTLEGVLTENISINFTGIIVLDNYIEYIRDGLFHRENGPAVESPEEKQYYINGKLHKEDGPAIEYTNGLKFWYFDELNHRIGGPAIEHPTGEKEYWVNGKLVSKEQHDFLYSIMKLKGLL